MSTKWFNSKKEIERKLISIAIFNELLKEREKAKIKLNEYVIGGKWYLKSDGQLSIINSIQKNQLNITELVLREAKYVMTFGEFKRLVDKHYGKMRIEYKPISYIPGPHTVCLHCKEKWALSDLETFVTSTRTLPVIDVVRLLGNKYSELIKRIIKGNDDSHVEIVKALNDLTGNFWIINKDNEKESKLITSFTCCEHYHNKCNKERVDKISIETSKEFLKCFKEAEVAVYGLVRTKNIYGSENTKGPWFIFDTELGHMKLGWIINTPHVDAFALHKDFFDPENSVFNLGKGFENGYSDVVKFLRIIKSKINKEKLNLPNFIDFKIQQSTYANTPHSM